jgi:hypothetical protein
MKYDLQLEVDLLAKHTVDRLRHESLVLIGDHADADFSTHGRLETTR